MVYNCGKRNTQQTYSRATTWQWQYRDLVAEQLIQLPEEKTYLSDEILSLAQQSSGINCVEAQ